MKTIKVRNCGDCFFIRNLADMEKTYCCVRKILFDCNEKAPYKITNLKRIPKWCPLEDMPEGK